MKHWAAVCLCLLPVAAVAGDEINLDSIVGHFSFSFENGTVSGEQFRSTDTLDIVRLNQRSVYLQTYLEFFNGHTCELHAVGQTSGNELVIHTRTGRGEVCDMTLAVADGKITFHDPNNCRAYFCGSRGGFASISFSLSGRKPIGDLARLKSSPEYVQALSEAGLKP